MAENRGHLKPSPGKAQAANKEGPLQFMKRAVSEASAGVRENHGGPFGAVIVRNRKVLARAHNEVIKTNDPTAHAEIVAIRRASARVKTFDLSDCVLYSTCEPCPMCLAAILWARIPWVYYGCTRRDAERIGFRDNLFYGQMRIRLGADSVKLLQLGRRECLVIFREWARKKYKVQY